MKKQLIEYGYIIYLSGIMLCPYIKNLDSFLLFWIVIAPVVILVEISKAFA